MTMRHNARNTREDHELIFYLDNFPPHWTWKELKDLVALSGKVRRADPLPSSSGGNRHVVGWVRVPPSSDIKERFDKTCRDAGPDIGIHIFRISTNGEIRLNFCNCYSEKTGLHRVPNVEAGTLVGLFRFHDPRFQRANAARWGIDTDAKTSDSPPASPQQPVFRQQMSMSPGVAAPTSTFDLAAMAASLPSPISSITYAQAVGAGFNERIPPQRVSASPLRGQVDVAAHLATSTTVTIQGLAPTVTEAILLQYLNLNIQPSTYAVIRDASGLSTGTARLTYATSEQAFEVMTFLSQRRNEQSRIQAWVEPRPLVAAPQTRPPHTIPQAAMSGIEHAQPRQTPAKAPSQPTSHSKPHTPSSSVSSTAPLKPPMVINGSAGRAGYQREHEPEEQTP